MACVLGARVDHSFRALGLSVRFGRGSSVQLLEGVARKDVPEGPSAAQGKLREMGDVVTPAHGERDAVPRSGDDLRDDSRQESNRLRGRVRELGVADLEEEGGQADDRAMVSRFVRRTHAERCGALVEEAKRGSHPTRVGRYEGPGATP
jgi:hypothetical protein